MYDDFRYKINFLDFQSAHLVMSQKVSRGRKGGRTGGGDVLLVYRS
jgi:hypothetical protein